jgi:hypothetical protein
MYKSISIHSRSTYWATHESNEELIVDSNDLSQEIEKICNQLDSEGFDIVSILPVNSGSVSHGSGYYQTESVIIIAKK